MPKPRASRPYDVVLYGASGFVGRQTVAYFARQAGGLRWARSGRRGVWRGQLRPMWSRVRWSRLTSGCG